MSLMKTFTWTLLFFLACFAGNGAARARVAEPEGFHIPPYVLEAGADSALVAFHLDSPMTAQVHVSDGEKTIIFSSPEPATSHFVKIDGLSPGRVFPYQVIAGDGQVRTLENDPRYAMKTAGQTGDSFHFAVFGDPRPGDTGSHRHHKEVVLAVADLEPAFYLVLGDMVDQGQNPELWQEFFLLEKDLMGKSAIFPVIGDNDVDSGRGIGDRFFPSLARGYYRFEWSGIQFFALNAWGSRGEQPRKELGKNSVQMKWFQQELELPEVKQAPFRVVFVHDPVYISRGRSADILKQEWAPVFEAGNVDIVFSSWHLYERSHHRGVTYVVSGGAGAELIWMAKDPSYESQAEARAHHFCRVDVNPRFMTLRAVATDGTVLDELTLTPKAGPGAGLEEPGQDKGDITGRIQQKILISGGENAPVLPLALFSYDCPFCRRLLNRIMPSLAESYGVSLEVSYFDLSLPEAYPLFLAAGQAFGRQDADLPAVFMGKEVFGGENRVRQDLAREIQAFQQNPQKYVKSSIAPFGKTVDSRDALTGAFHSLRLGMVLSAGLLDGLNPCAFATIILLVSYLTLFGLDQKTVIWTGASFTLGVFVSYLFIGLVFYHWLRQALVNPVLSTIINCLMLAMVILLAGLSLVDAFRAAWGHKKGQLLKLPSSASGKIESLVKKFARNPSLKFGTPFFLGVLISGLEFTCTGQVYVPIVTMLADPQYRLNGFSYLVAYNLAFILPLVMVFFGTAYGVRFAGTVRRPGFVMAAKLGHFALFTVMAVVITYNLGWL